MVAAVEQAARAGAWGQYVGPGCERLKSILREHHQVEHAWLCSSGTAAVELALRGLGVGAGDEVLLAAYDFKANFTDILALGATPVLIDLRPDDWQLDVERVAEAVTERTKAVLVSHLHGGSVRMSDLRAALQGRAIGLVEDACQCPGAVLDGRPAGTAGDVGVLSFGGSKLTSAGRGGAVISSRRDVIERIRRHVMRGNDLSPLSELQAAALIPQWLELPAANARRSAQVHTLANLLSSVPALRLLTPPTAPTAAGYYKVGFEYDPAPLGGLPRERFCEALRAEGIAFSSGFRGLHRIHASRRFRTAGRLPVADLADERMVVLHHPVLLEGEREMQEIADAVEKVAAAADELGRLPARPFTGPEDCDE